MLESGRPSAEHVPNVIARLTDEPEPPLGHDHSHRRDGTAGRAATLRQAARGGSPWLI